MIFNSGGNAFSTGRLLLEEVGVEGAAACGAQHRNHGASVVAEVEPENVFLHTQLH